MKDKTLLTAKIAWEIPSASGDTPARPGTPESTKRLAQILFDEVNKQLDNK